MRKFFGKTQPQIQDLQSPGQQQQQVVTTANQQSLNASPESRQQNKPYKSSQPFKQDQLMSEYQSDNYDQENLSLADIERQKYISSTAEGDGLEFDRRLGTIFDEIETIKSGILKPNAIDPIVEEVGFKLEDVPDNLSPVSILLESMQQLEQVKADMLDVQRKEEEFLRAIRSLKSDTQVNTCSHTLNALIREYKQYAESNDTLISRISVLERDKFNQQQLLRASQDENTSLKGFIDKMQEEVNYQIDENKKSKKKIEMMKRQREEKSDMSSEENKKILLDTQVFKDKVYKYKMELHDLKKKCNDLEKYQNLYEDLKSKDSERQLIEIEIKTQEQLKRQKEIKSLLGHLKVLKDNKNSLIKAEQALSPFSQETCTFLVPQDIMKLTCLNRKFSQTFLKYNSRLFIRMFNQRGFDMSLRIRELDQKCELQQFMIKRNETRDQIRNMISQEAGDDKLRYIIEKHVVQPHKLKQSQQHTTDKPTTSNLLMEVENSISSVTEFLASYYEQVRQQQIRFQELIHAQQQQKIQQLLNTSQSSLDSTQISQDNSYGQKQKVSKVSKLAGAFSYFGSFRSSKKNVAKEKDQLQPIESQQNQSQQQNEELDKVPTDQDNLNEAHNKDFTAVVEEASIQEASTNDNQILIQEESKEEFENLNNSQFQFEQAKDIEQSLGTSQQDSRKSSEEQSDNSIQKSSEESIKTIDQVRTIEDMHEFLYKIGSSLIGDKSKLAQWIRGIQEGFADFYILSKYLYSENYELSLLKDFLVMRVENLKLKVHELLNEKEDMAAIHQSDSGVKEHLINRINELDKFIMEKSTELLFAKRKVQELTEYKNEFDNKLEKQQREINEFKARVHREGKILRERVGKLTEENVNYQKALDEMKVFFNKVNSI